MGLTCGVCQGPLDNVTDYLIENIRKGNNTSFGKCSECMKLAAPKPKECMQCRRRLPRNAFSSTQWNEKRNDNRKCNICINENAEREAKEAAKKYFCDHCKTPVDMASEDRTAKRNFRFSNGIRNAPLYCESYSAKNKKGSVQDLQTDSKRR